MKLSPDSGTVANGLASLSGKHPWEEREWKSSHKEVGEEVSE